MNRYAPYCLYLAILALLTSCAAPIYQLTPKTGDVAWIDGRPTTKAQLGGLKLVASYERLDLDFVALDIELKNVSDTAIEINPADFRYAALGENERDTLRHPNNLAYPLVYTAADPTREADRVIALRDREIRRLKTARVINTVLLVAAVASDVASSTSSRNRGEPGRWVQNRITHDNMYTAIQAKRMIDHGTFADRMERYDYESYRWEKLALRRTVLQPGEAARGQVFLPLNREAGHLLLSYPVAENESMRLLFRQEWIRPQRRRP